MFRAFFCALFQKRENKKTGSHRGKEEKAVLPVCMVNS